MENSNEIHYGPACLLAHHLVDKLSVIVGYCDLLTEQTELDRENAMRLRLVRDMAKAMAEKLATNQCQPAETASGAGERRHPLPLRSSVPL